MNAHADGRVPPNDLDAERAVLAACLLDSAALDEVSDLLGSEHWYSPAHRLVWEAVHKLHAKSQAVDVVTVAQALRVAGQLDGVGGARYLAELSDATPSTAHVRQHAESVVALATLRRAIAICHEAAAAGYGASGDVAAHLRSLEEAVLGLGSLESTARLVEAKAGLTDAVQRIVRFSEGVSPGLATGLGSIDRLTGGLRPGDLTVIAGRPGSGKSALAWTVARNVAFAGKGALVFSHEMPGEQLWDRLLSAEGHVDLRMLRQGKLDELQWRKVMGCAEQWSTIPLAVDDSSNLTAVDVRARTRRHQRTLARRNVELGVVVVDYLQLMSGDERARSREQEVSGMSRGLKAMAKALRVPVIALSQLNRSVEGRSDKRPNLADLRESGAIEQDADAVILLYRPGYYLEQEGKQDDTGGLTEAIVAKQRNGPTGVARLHWWASEVTFTEWEES